MQACPRRRQNSSRRWKNCEHFSRNSILTLGCQNLCFKANPPRQHLPTLTSRMFQPIFAVHCCVTVQDGSGKISKEEFSTHMKDVTLFKICTWSFEDIKVLLCGSDCVGLYGGKFSNKKALPGPHLYKNTSKQQNSKHELCSWPTIIAVACWKHTNSATSKGPYRVVHAQPGF